MTDKDYRAFIIDKVWPQVAAILESPDAIIKVVAEKQLRYLAETILLELGDELPQSRVPS